MVGREEERGRRREKHEVKIDVCVCEMGSKDITIRGRERKEISVLFM